VSAPAGSSVATAAGWEHEPDYRSAGLRGGLRGASLEAVLAALWLPPLFLHEQWQPGLVVHLGGATLHTRLSDLALLVILSLAVMSGIRRGLAPLAASSWIWLTTALSLAWIVVEFANAPGVTQGYPVASHAVTAAKWIEYALLAPAIPLLVRRRADLRALVWSLTLWSLLASVVGVAQFAGAAILDHGVSGGRQGSYLGLSDFAALSATTLIAGAVALLVPRAQLGRRLGIVAAAAGAVGVALAAALAAVFGLVTGGLLIGARLARRRKLPRRYAAAAVAAVALAFVGAVALRGGDIGSYARFLGVSSSSRGAQEKTVQSYAQHTLLAWIGIQIWKDSPLIGSGWEASQDPATFQPYLAAAHRRFPNEPALAFPSTSHPYGVQNMWVQSLADLGIVGFCLVVAMFGTVLVSGWRSAAVEDDAAALIGLGVTGLVVWLWAAQGFVAGIPLDAVTWLGFGLVATGNAWAARR
jgi:O-antigen ligase